MAFTRVIVPTPRIVAITETIDQILAAHLPADQAEPDEVIYLALWMMRNVARCLQRVVSCEEYLLIAHMAYHRAEEEDLTPDELLLKRFDTEDETPRH